MSKVKSSKKLKNLDNIIEVNSNMEKSKFSYGSMKKYKNMFKNNFDKKKDSKNDIKESIEINSNTKKMADSPFIFNKKNIKEKTEFSVH